MTRQSLKSSFGEQIRAFVGYKNSLGFPYDESSRILWKFDDFCVERFPEKIVWIVNSHLHGWRNEIRKTQQATEIALWSYGSLQSTFGLLEQKHI
mgnify:CR=1 FL=1